MASKLWVIPSEFFMPIILPIPKRSSLSSGNQMLLLPTVRCRCTLFGKSSRLLTLMVNLALTAVITSVGTLPKKSGDPSFRLCCGSPFSNIICLELYNEYDTFLPSDQVALLQLWDEISLPHEEVKQICGTCIPIIGF